MLITVATVAMLVHWRLSSSVSYSCCRQTGRPELFNCNADRLTARLVDSATEIIGLIAWDWTATHLQRWGVSCLYVGSLCDAACCRVWLTVGDVQLTTDHWHYILTSLTSPAHQPGVLLYSSPCSRCRVWLVTRWVDSWSLTWIQSDAAPAMSQH